MKNFNAKSTALKDMAEEIPANIDQHGDQWNYTAYHFIGKKEIKEMNAQLGIHRPNVRLYSNAKARAEV